MCVGLGRSAEGGLRDRNGIGISYAGSVSSGRPFSSAHGICPLLKRLKEELTFVSLEKRLEYQDGYHDDLHIAEIKSPRYSPTATPSSISSEMKRNGRKGGMM